MHDNQFCRRAPRNDSKKFFQGSIDSAVRSSLFPFLGAELAGAGPFCNGLVLAWDWTMDYSFLGFFMLFLEIIVVRNNGNNTTLAVLPNRLPMVRRWIWSFLLFSLVWFGAGDRAAALEESTRQYLVRNWGLDEGLPQTTVTCFAQTPDGYLWFGTLNGLVRFDGVRFKVFGDFAEPGLPNREIINLHVDKSGRLWIKTIHSTGISLLEKGVFRFLTTADGVVNGPGFSFHEPVRDNLILLRTNHLMRKFDGLKFIESSDLVKLARHKGFILREDLVGNLYGIGELSLSWFNREEWVETTTPDGSPKPHVQGTALARSGGIWVAANKHIGRFDKGVWHESAGEYPWPRKRIRAHTLMEDSDGNLWAGSYGDGLYRWNGKSWKLVEGLPATVIRSLFEDHEGNIWVGTDGGGLCQLKPKLFNNYTTRDGLPENIITAVREVNPGEMWIGTHGGGLVVMKDSRFHPVYFPEYLNYRWFWALDADRSGTVWAGLYGSKVFSFANGNYQKPTELPVSKENQREAITAVLTDRSGGLWVATRNGLLRYDNGVPHEFTSQDGLSGVSIRAIVETTDGVLWVGTEKGLHRFDHGTFTSIGGKEKLGDVLGLHAYKNDLWVGMGDKKGLARIRGNEIVVFKPEHGLSHDSTENIIADDSGNLWVTGNRGLCRMVLSDLEAFAEGKRKSIEGFIYGKDDGLGSKEMPAGHQPNVWKGRDGRLWFGTVGGLSVIDPKHIKPNLIPPRVWIEEVLADDRPKRSGIQSALPAKISINPGSRTVEIHYTALSFLAPGQVLFKYRLHGFDKDWTLAGNRRVAYYQGLSPGTYKFHVAACNNHGVWNETGATLTLTMLPFFYQNIWFQASALLGIILLVLYAFNRRVSVLKHERQIQRDFSQRLIQSQEQERKRLAGEIHDSLGQNLLIIKNRALIALSEAGSTQVASHLQEIANSAGEAVNEVRTISHNLRPYQLDRLGLTKALEAILNQFGTASLTIFKEIESVDKLIPAEHEINLYRIVQESLSNTVKHSRARNVWVTIKRENFRIVATIRDDGGGFDYNAMISDRGSKRGLGLTGLVERAHAMGGRLEIDSRPGHGTFLTLVVPIENGRGGDAGPGHN